MNPGPAHPPDTPPDDPDAKGKNQHLSKRAEADARALAEREPDASRPRIRLALHCWRKGELEEALDWADSALSLDPRNVTTYRLRANILADMGQTGKAVETALRALAAAPHSVPAHVLAIRMLLRDLQPRRAQELLDAAEEQGPDPDELRQLATLRLQIHSMSRQAEQNPLDWLARKFNRRRARVAEAESNDS